MPVRSCAIQRADGQRVICSGTPVPTGCQAKSHHLFRMAVSTLRFDQTGTAVAILVTLNFQLYEARYDVQCRPSNVAAFQ